MTTLLKDTMSERADALESPHFDALALAAAGRRRVTRRRSALAGAGAVAAVSLAALVVPGLGNRDDVADPVSEFAAAFAAHEPSYAVDGTIHIDGRAFDVGHRVRALVQTDRGVVFTDPAGDVFAADGATVDAVGHTDPGRFGQRLVADGARVAWLDTTAERFVTLDQGTGDRETLPAQPIEGSEFGARPLAVDGDVVYAVDARGLFGWNLAAGRVSVGDIEPRGDEAFDVKDGSAATGWGGRGSVGTVESVPTRFGDALLPLVRVTGGQTAEVSPDGSRAVVELDPESVVVDLEDGTSATLSAPGFDFVAGYQWRDDGSFFALGLSSTRGPLASMPISILECQAASATCAPVVPEAGTYEHLALPFGLPFED